MGEQEQQKLKWQAHKVENKNIHSEYEGPCSNIFRCNFPKLQKKSLENDLIRRTDTIFWDIFQPFLNKHGNIQPIDIEVNNDWLRKLWDPSDRFKKLFG